jgi:hypothetical protein
MIYELKDCIFYHLRDQYQAKLILFWLYPVLLRAAMNISIVQSDQLHVVIILVCLTVFQMGNSNAK